MIYTLQVKCEKLIIILPRIYYTIYFNGQLLKKKKKHFFALGEHIDLKTFRYLYVLHFTIIAFHYIIIYYYYLCTVHTDRTHTVGKICDALMRVNRRMWTRDKRNTHCARTGGADIAIVGE